MDWLVGNEKGLYSKHSEKAIKNSEGILKSRSKGCVPSCNILAWRCGILYLNNNKKLIYGMPGTGNLSD